MRSLLALAAVLLATATGCSSSDGGDGGTAAPPASSAPSTSAPSVPDVPEVPEVPGLPGVPSQSAASADPTCAEVVAGINAFNAGDLDETVAHFRAAVPLAEAADDGSSDAELLLQAVRYYAGLPAADYPDAAATSPDFARWKAVTLGQCVGDGGSGGGSGGASEAPGVEA